MRHRMQTYVLCFIKIYMNFGLNIFTLKKEQIYKYVVGFTTTWLGMRFETLELF